MSLNCLFIRNEDYQLFETQFKSVSLWTLST